MNSLIQKIYLNTRTPSLLKYPLLEVRKRNKKNKIDFNKDKYLKINQKTNLNKNKGILKDHREKNKMSSL